ncbi:Rieske 2Fe-2S domain-containing protein [Sphingomonas canadensis]|uniref:Rieske 2Fe-2S domain-containing protein n=1 Tax=Sphingomonas canadensis TaxID=1219257 RepID=A0ABW3HAY5_9SPHN|nr:Rieske 2Fe-2S domain-containing protein [Sphingomonas canadensis]MCW3837017.1 Rieske 2Fe-2S domain-containing protein [Sphingomonas canadensis]
MNERTAESAAMERLRKLHLTGADTAMGKLLRSFWQPVGRSEDVQPGRARKLRVMGEDLTLYRGETGTPFLVGGLCPHRLTLLANGWVQGDELRCMYHGWKFDGKGRCTERPAELSAGNGHIKVASYPVQEYAGLIFAYMGMGEAPAFELPRKSVFERPGALQFARIETWPCNWLQQVENSMDAVHVSFVHHWGRVGSFGSVVAATVPELSYEETEAGIRQTAVRSQGSKRVSDWTFPNNNHISHPTLEVDDPWVDVGVWMTPVDDENTMRFLIYSIPSTTPETDARIREYFEKYSEYDPADHHEDLFVKGNLPDDRLVQLTSAQDYVAAVGQGAIVDRTKEVLGRSDMGIALLRRLYLREMAAIEKGVPGKAWQRLSADAHMPKQVNEVAA